MIKQYDIVPQAAKQIKRIKTIEILVSFTTAIIAIQAALYFILEPNLSTAAFLSVSLIVIITVLVIEYFIISDWAKSFYQIRVSLDNDTLVVHKGSDFPIVIHRSKIKDIFEVEKKGVRIVSVEHESSVFVPNQLTNFDDFKSTLTSWHTFTKTSDDPLRTFRLDLVIILALIGLFLLEIIKFPENMIPIRNIFLLLFLMTFIATELIVGKATLGPGGSSISRIDDAGHFWLIIGMQLSPFPVFILAFDFKTFLIFNLQVILLVISAATIWITVTVIFVVKAMRKYSIQSRERAEYEKAQGFDWIKNLDNKYG
jgi:hypothetical protein